MLLIPLVRLDLHSSYVVAIQSYNWIRHISVQWPPIFSTLGGHTTTLEKNPFCFHNTNYLHVMGRPAEFFKLLGCSQVGVSRVIRPSMLWSCGQKFLCTLDFTETFSEVWECLVNVTNFMQIQSQTCWQLDSSSSSHHNISELCSRNEIWHIYLENNFFE